MSVKWNDSELTLLEALRPVCSTREIKKVFELLDYDRTMEAISKKSRTLDVSFRDFGEPVLIDLSKDEKQAVMSVISDREDQLATIVPPPTMTSAEKGKQTTKKREAYSKLMDDLQEIRREVPRTSSLSTRRQDSDKQSVVLMLSDFHIGKKVVNENDQEIFNVEIGTRMIEQTPELLMDQLGPRIRKEADEIVVLLIGDHIDGEQIYHGQEMDLEVHAAEQVKAVSKATWKTLKSFRKIFPMVRVVTVRGNHGRTNASREANWDNIFYQQLELLVDLESDPNLIIKNRYGEFNNFEVKGWRGHMRHWAPVQADTPSSRDRFNGWKNMHHYDFLCYGHWHHWGLFSLNNSLIIRNGSLPGGDDYAEKFGSFDVPTQVVFGVSKEKVGTFISTIKYPFEA